MLYLTPLSTLQHRLHLIDVVKRYIFSVAFHLATWERNNTIECYHFLKLLFAHTLFVFCYYLIVYDAKIQEIFELCKLFSLKIVKLSDFSANPLIFSFSVQRYNHLQPLLFPLECSHTNYDMGLLICYISYS